MQDGGLELEMQLATYTFSVGGKVADVSCLSRCYGLDLECSPKANVLKTWSLQVALLGGIRIFRRWDLVEGS